MSSAVQVGTVAFKCDVRLTVHFSGFSQATQNEARAAMHSDDTLYIFLYVLLTVNVIYSDTSANE